MPAKGFFGGLKAIDAFGKTMEDVKVRTRTGAFLTLVSLAIILSFTTIEFLEPECDVPESTMLSFIPRLDGYIWGAPA